MNYNLYSVTIYYLNVKPVRDNYNFNKMWDNIRTTQCFSVNQNWKLTQTSLFKNDCV